MIFQLISHSINQNIQSHECAYIIRKLWTVKKYIESLCCTTLCAKHLECAREDEYSCKDPQKNLLRKRTREEPFAVVWSLVLSVVIYVWCGVYFQSKEQVSPAAWYSQGRPVEHRL